MKTSIKISRYLLLGTILFLCADYSPVLAAKENIFVSIPPQKWICDTLSEQKVTTSVLIDKNQDPHTYEPSPRQIMEVTRARLYLKTGLPFERRLLHVLKNNSNKIRIIDITEGATRLVPGQHIETEHSHHDHDHHGHGNIDPHLWLAPKNLKILVSNTADALMELDPEHSQLYKKNSEKLKSRIDDLDQKLAAQLSPYKGESFYVFHPAFGYFAASYHLHQKAVELNGKSPTPKQLASIISEAKTEKIKVIFVQPQFDMKSARAIANAISASIVLLDPMAPDIIENLSYLGDSIEKALQK